MKIKTLKSVASFKQRELSSAQQQLEQKKIALVEFEQAIEALQQPALVSVGASPTETMNQIIGDAKSTEEKYHKLEAAKAAAEQHYKQIAALQKLVVKLQADVETWNSKLDWAENYEHLAEELRPKYSPNKVITNRIECRKTSITNIRNTISQRKTRISNWDNERAQLVRQLEQQGMGINRLNENIPNELADQNLQDERQIGFIEDRIKDDEFHLEQDFRQFVRSQVARSNALQQLRPDFQQLEDIIQEHRAIAEQLQSKLSEFPVLQDLIIPIPQEINYE